VSKCIAVAHHDAERGGEAVVRNDPVAYAFSLNFAFVRAQRKIRVPSGRTTEGGRVSNPIKAIVYGAEADALLPELKKFPQIAIVENAPDVIVCYGGDGTLLSAELKWPGIPKVPIRNSRRGNRCIPHPPAKVMDRLVTNRLTRTEFAKISCAVFSDGAEQPKHTVTAMNECNVHMGHINLAVRFKIWLGDEPFGNGTEIIGDGFIVSTPFGSTAYFNQITRGVFHTGIGIAFKNTAELTSHLVVPDDTVVRAQITRGPAVLAYDNTPEYVKLQEGDRLELRKADTPATVLTWEPLANPANGF
jgi:NAD+ kinase